MPKNQNRKDEIRAYAAQHNISYTTALRAVDASANVTEVEPLLPIIYGDLYALIAQAPSRYTKRVEDYAAIHLAHVHAALAAVPAATLLTEDRAVTYDWGADTIQLEHRLVILDGSEIESEVTVTTTGAPRSRTLKTTVAVFGPDADRIGVDVTERAAAADIESGKAELIEQAQYHGSHPAQQYRQALWMGERDLTFTTDLTCLCDLVAWNGSYHYHFARGSECSIPRGGTLFDHNTNYSHVVAGRNRPVAFSWAPYLSVAEMDATGHTQKLRDWAQGNGLSIRIGDPADNVYGHGSTTVLVWFPGAIDL